MLQRRGGPGAHPRHRCGRPPPRRRACPTPGAGSRPRRCAARLDPAARRRLGHGRLRAAGRTTPGPLARGRQRPRPAIRSPAASGRARRCACSPAASCPTAPTAVLLQEDADRDGDALTSREAPVRRAATSAARGQDFARRRRAAAGRHAARRPRRRPGRGGEPPLARRASPPARRHPRHRRRDRAARRADPARRHRQLQRARPRRPGARRRRRAGGAADRAATGPTRSPPRGRSAGAAPTCWSPPAAPASASTTWCRPGLGARGFELDFWKIAMRPGKPLMFGRLGATPVLGLPGNPVSALVCAVLFLLPALDRLLGLPGDAAAPLAGAARRAPSRANDHRADHLRATLAGDAGRHCSRDAVPAAGFVHAAPARPSRRAGPARAARAGAAGGRVGRRSIRLDHLGLLTTGSS